jgi:5-methylcytosine-specific restriction endonuclease McrA
MTRLKSVPARLSTTPQRLTMSCASVSWRSGKEGSTARGYGYRWQQYRQTYLMSHPLCVRCHALGSVVAATVVDHVTPHRGDAALFWDEQNHQALCKPCHDSAKAREEHAAGQR